MIGDNLNLIITKPWGYEKILEKNNHYVVKILHIKKGHKLSLQYHERKTETLFLYKGKGHVVKWNRGGSKYEYMETPLQKVHIPRGWVHRIEAIEDLEILEVSTIELDDVVRMEDDYGRAQPILEHGYEMPAQAFKS